MQTMVHIVLASLNRLAFMFGITRSFERCASGSERTRAQNRRHLVGRRALESASILSLHVPLPWT